MYTLLYNVWLTAAKIVATIRKNFKDIKLIEVRNFRVTKSSYKTELRKTTSHFARSQKMKVSLRVTYSKSKNKNFHFELLTRKFNFYFSTFGLPTRS